MERRVCEVPPLLDRLVNEIRILSAVKHPNIVKLISLKKTQNHWYLITEFVSGGSLSEALKKYMAMYQRPFPEDVVQHLMRQIVSAVQYLHFNKISYFTHSYTLYIIITFVIFFKIFNLISIFIFK